MSGYNMRNFKKSYYLAYSVLDFGCDVRVRHVIVDARSALYAVEKLTKLLSGLYRDFRIGKVVREFYF
ncbi:hypothetical protein [Blackfly microvirus SF02]|uniref:Uncharacterized protein n=1 Tax=Blackfly microvirus SF02 TaxID=2576452 RepID=A0A4P8PK05_9VIRU|nr:hypothetical protein [Blackfly microvirus SF02]